MASKRLATIMNTVQQVQQRRVLFNDVKKDVEAAGDCFLVLNGVVYDARDLVKTHPGGSDLVLTEVGKNASQDPDSAKPPETETESAARRLQARQTMPPAKDISLLEDFEPLAHKVLTDVAWAYYRSAAGQERSYDGNIEALRRYFFRPRMLRDMSNGSTKTSFLGFPCDLPIYISPTAMFKLGHPIGEVNVTRAAADCGIVQTISANASCSLEEIFEAKQRSQTLLFQIYIDKDRNESAKLLQKVERLGVKAIVFTIDVGWESKRTRENGINGTIPKSALGAFMAAGRLQDRVLSWDDIAWIRRHTKLPIIVKGVSSLEDLELCVKYGAEGVILSNHGGRQVDFAPAPIDILYEARSYRPDLFEKIDIMIDGGVRSGVDVVKLLALGAKAVGFGRSFLYANATHGEEGVRRVIEILREEIVNTMRNIGAATISDLKPEMVGPSGPWVGWNRPSYVAAREAKS